MQPEDEILRLEAALPGGLGIAGHGGEGWHRWHRVASHESVLADPD